jgi:uncharacterized Zn ribbon protein
MTAIIIKDSDGTPSSDGDSVQVTKDLKVKGLVFKTCVPKKA